MFRSQGARLEIEFSEFRPDPLLFLVYEAAAVRVVPLVSATRPDVPVVDHPHSACHSTWRGPITLTASACPGSLTR